MNVRAQGALEYLLLIGGAVLIAAIVLTMLANIGQQQQGQTEVKTLAAQCEGLTTDRCTDAVWAPQGKDLTGASVVACELTGTAPNQKCKLKSGITPLSSR